MSAKHASVKLSADFVNEARREAETFNRSVAAQVEHWAKLGRAMENAPGVGVREVQSLFDGTVKVEDLAPAVRGAFWAHITDSFKAPDDEIRSAYAMLGAAERQ